MSQKIPPPDSFFYARQQNASRVFDIVEMSVCPSQYFVKTTQARIAKSSLLTATMTLVSGSAKPFQKFERGHPYRWRKMKRGFKKLAKKPRYWDQFVSPAQQWGPYRRYSRLSSENGKFSRWAGIIWHNFIKFNKKSELMLIRRARAGNRGQSPSISSQFTLFNPKSPKIT